ncbi:unnamed protein product [Leptosia nina]|uniref:RFX-type winged-helix domain-containing protein n=1 Tax=Leptosia nina TaxID=320188 RepID=A0AAV1JIM2_9NEOP
MENTAPFQPWTVEESSKNVKSEKELADDAKLHRENVNHPKHRQTASYDKETIVASSNNPGPSGSSETGSDPAIGKESKMDSGKISSMQQIVENTISQEGKQRVSQLLEAVEALSGAERLLLYLRLPTGVPPHDPLKQPVNPLGSRAELQQTVTWIQTHLEVDPDVSLPKQDVYDEYIAHCMSSNMKPLSTADFGKVMKQVYPSVRPRRLGTRGNSRYCYAGLRKKVKLEVPQLPDLGEASKEGHVGSRENERIICDWAETKLGVKFNSIIELSRHLASLSAQRAPPGPSSASPPPMSVLVPNEESSGPQLLKQLKRKLQGTPGRPKKNKGQDIIVESPPSTSYMASQHPPVKHESEMIPEASYAYQQPYVPVYDVRPPFPYAAPPRAHPPHVSPVPHPLAIHEYRPDPYVFEPPYVPREDTAHNLPINLSTDASLDLSTERTEWQRRRPPDPQTHRLPLPGKKLILETYQSETQASSPRSHTETYLPKKMRAAEILGGKVSASRQTAPGPDQATSSTASFDPSLRSEVAFLEDPKNLPSRSKSTAAALAREEQEAASPTRAVKAQAAKCERAGRKHCGRAASPAPPDPLQGPASDSCCGIDGINIKTGMICGEKHSEILNRERVISICNIDKHALDDYLNENNSQEHEEELLKYFHPKDTDKDAPPNANAAGNSSAFLETSQDTHDEHSQGKNEKISQLRELLAKNLKNPSGTNPPTMSANLDQEVSVESYSQENKIADAEGAFKPVISLENSTNDSNFAMQNEISNKQCNAMTNGNDSSATYNCDNPSQLISGVGPHLYNGNCNNEPQSPTTRTQQYDFVPISDGCHSPRNFNSKSPLGFGQRINSPTKASKPGIMTGSLQTSPVSHSTAASPFVSPRNTPVPRSRLCSRPIPKLTGRKRRNPLTLGMADHCSNNNRPFAIPNDQKFVTKTSCNTSIKYCQPMSAPPSPNILSHYKYQALQNSGIPNGINNMCLFSANSFRDNVNGDSAQPLSADPLSSEVSQFFQEPMPNYRPSHDTTFRSQSVPLKQAINNMTLLSYNNTPVGSVPPTPVPNEFCDFGSLADCDISKAGLNPETLDKIYDAIDSSNEVLNAGTTTSLLNSNNPLTNGCDTLSNQPMLTDEHLSTFIPTGSELLDRNGQFPETFANDSSSENVEEFLKRTNSIEFHISELETDKSKYYTSRSVPSTPLPFKRVLPNLQIDSRRSRELFAADTYTNMSNGISSKSVPSTPQLAEDRSIFSYSNRDFLINGNSVEICGTSQVRPLVDNEQGLTSPLDVLREDILDPLTPAADLLADLDKIDGAPYVDL